MPHDVIMPALGMAQDSGVLVTWLKQPGDAVAEGDALFEVETDKATMEVEAQAAGYLTDVTAPAGAEVPVGQVIARVSDTPEGAGPAADSHDTPEEIVTTAEPGPVTGEEVIMPALGMAQDTGLIVAWHKDAGEAVAAGDILFEVETDKSTMEVEAGHDGYVAALLAEAGEEAAVGAAIAVISAEQPQAPVRRSIKEAAPPPASASAPETPARPPEKADEQPAAPAAPTRAAGGRILASPKARRLALEQGLDLARLAEAGHPQPYHVKDLETLKALPEAPAARPAGAAARRLTAEVPACGFAGFADWAAREAGLTDTGALLAGLAGASLRPGATVAVEAFGQTRLFAVPSGRLGAVAEAAPDTTPDLRLRDMRVTRLSAVQMGGEDTPVLTVTAAGAGLTLTLECAADQLAAPEAITLLSDFAGRMEQPLRHLL